MIINILILTYEVKHADIGIGRAQTLAQVGILNNPSHIIIEEIRQCSHWLCANLLALLKSRLIANKFFKK